MYNTIPLLFVFIAFFIWGLNRGIAGKWWGWIVMGVFGIAAVIQAWWVFF